MSDEAVLDAPVPAEKKSFDTPILIGALVVIAAMAAWFFLGSDGKVVESAPAVAAEPTPEQAEVQAVVAAETPNGELLSRARLAADAGMLTEPAGSNALYYYALFLEQAQADDTVVAEVDAVVNRVGSLVDAALGGEDWARANYVVEQLNNSGFEHDSIARFDQRLGDFRQSQSSLALTAADSGDEAQANAILDTLAALPRTQAGELLALRADVRDRIDAQRVAAQAAAERAAAAERQRAQQQQQQAAARAAARTAPSTATSTPTPPPAAPQQDAGEIAVREALAAGSFRGRSGAVALLDNVSNASTRQSLQGEVVAALASGIRDASVAADPGTADRLYREYGKLVIADTSEKTELLAAVDQAFIAAATSEVVSAATLRRTKAVAPIYPRRALQRGVNGRVKVEFTVGTDGKTREIEVVESSSGSLFDRSALRAISEWEYEPRLVRGQAVAQRVYAYLDYNLE
ncbi:MAG: TonB family protein [Pseudomonadota bacterium]